MISLGIVALGLVMGTFALALISAYGTTTLTGTLTSRSAGVLGVGGGFLAYWLDGFTHLTDIIVLGFSFASIGALVFSLGLCFFIVVMLWNLSETGGKTAVR